LLLLVALFQRFNWWRVSNQYPAPIGRYTAKRRQSPWPQVASFLCHWDQGCAAH
jgi:hypothetical protein